MNSDRGLITVILLWIMVPLVALVQVSLSRGATQINGAHRFIEQARAFYRAEAVLDDALECINQGSDLTDAGSTCNECQAGPPTFEGATASVCVPNDRGDGTIELIVDGYYPDTTNPTYNNRISIDLNLQDLWYKQAPSWIASLTLNASDRLFSFLAGLSYYTNSTY